MEGLAYKYISYFFLEDFRVIIVTFQKVFFYNTILRRR